MSSNQQESSNDNDSNEAMYVQIFFFLYLKFFIFREQKNFQLRPETYNGADRDLYCWTQTISDIDVRVKVIMNLKT